MPMPADMDQIVAGLKLHRLSLPEPDLEALRAQLEVNAHLVRALTEKPGLIQPETCPALQPAWALTGEAAVPQADAASGPASRRVADFPRRYETPTEAVEAALTQIEKRPASAVFIQVFADESHKEARAMERRATAQGMGQSGSRPEALPLWGTTVSIKDLMRIKGYPMTGGTRALSWPAADRDAVVVERLRRAGAVVIGTTNLHELAFGTTGANPHFGVPPNPAVPGRLPGGSSSGSAASVGFGMATFSIGTDTGGSIRIPAACCGVVGFKPSFGLLSTQGVFPLGYSLDHVGPITRTVTEAALLMDVLSERPGAYTARLEAPLKGLRIGVPTNFFILAQPAVLAAYEATLERARTGGARLVPISLPSMDLAPAVYLCTSGVEAVAIHYHTLVLHGEKLGQDVRVRLAANLFLPAYARVKAQQLRAVMFQELADAFQRVDVIATPTLPIAPPSVGTATVRVQDVEMATTAAFLRNTSPFNLTGLPAISLPNGTDPEGAPIGLQLVGPYRADARVLQAARALEREALG